MGIEWGIESVLSAQRRGLNADWIRRAAEQSDEAPHILEARRITRGGSADGLVRPGDLLLSIDGRIVTRLTEAGSAAGQVEMRLLRNGIEQTVTLDGQRLSSDPIRRLVLWGGASFQAPHLALAQQRGQDQDGVYVAYWWRGSPAGRFGLRPMRRIIAVDGAPTPDLDAFVDAVRNKGSGDAIRLVTLDLRGVRRMITIEADTHYWPLTELQRSKDGWTRRAIGPKNDD